MEKKPIYVGSCKNLHRRIIGNHCGGSINSSVLRKTIAIKDLHQNVEKFRRSSGSNGFRLKDQDKEQAKKIEENISRFVDQGE